MNIQTNPLEGTQFACAIQEQPGSVQQDSLSQARERKQPPDIVVIANPHARLLSAGSHVHEEVAVRLRLQGRKVDVAVEPSDEAAIARVEEAGRTGAEAVVAVGGDGTIHAVVEGLLRVRAAGATVPLLGIVPAGTMNNIAWALGIPEQQDDALEVIVAGLDAGESRAVDVGVVGDHPFVEVLDMGMEADLYPTIGQVKGRPWALPSALLSMTQVMRHAYHNRVAVHVDGRRITANVLGVSLCNTPSYGAHFLVAPKAQMDDGKLDGVIFTDKTRWSLVRHFIALIGRVSTHASATRRFRGQVVRIRPQRPWTVRLDGIPLADGGHDHAVAEIEAHVLHAAIRVCAPSPDSGETPPPEHWLRTALRALSSLAPPQRLWTRRTQRNAPLEEL